MSSWAELVGNVGNDQYDKRIAMLKAKKIDTGCIEQAVGATMKNLQAGNGRAFVIFGEPQSGKTEMMIALNAKLIDKGAEVIINLLTDSIDLLDQSLSRFRASGLSPSPKQFNELPNNPIELKGKKWLIFSKKNARDLEKLIELLKHKNNIIVIDDEADYASPNAKVNKDEKTKINQLIFNLLGENGQYIGVTATPARLNLNNTFENDSELWVNFPPHSNYVGQDFFFPSDGKVKYRLKTFHADEGSERIELQTAILHFLCGVAEQHELGLKENFTMLVHTSGKKDEHQEDVQVIQSTISALSNKSHSNFNNIVQRLEDVARQYAVNDHDAIVGFVLRNIDRHLIVEVNSRGTSGNVAKIANPTSLFSFGAGGNIISRGVTFDNLLSMYFTRAVKGKFAQDTYIQRARMFGNRSAYKTSFQLWIPRELLANWSKCFSFHKLALEAMRSSTGAPVWLSDHKTIPTSPASIDKSTVDFEGGEMSFGIFDYDKSHSDLFDRGDRSSIEMLDKLKAELSNTEFPEYLHKYLSNEVKNSQSDISFHRPSQFGTSASAYTEDEKKTIRRKKGIFANNEFSRSENPSARHHLKIFFNEYGKARLFYKINGSAINFIQSKR